MMAKLVIQQFASASFILIAIISLFQPISCKFSSRQVVRVDNILQQKRHESSLYIPIRRHNANKKKVNQEDQEQSENPATPDANNNSKVEEDEYQSKKTRKYAEFTIDESTNFILIDQSNEIGYLSGKINNFNSTSSTSSNKTDSQYGKIKKDQQQNSNYTIFLMSKYDKHLAVMLDIVDANFEQVLNCEHQELEIDVIGDIDNTEFMKVINESKPSFLDNLDDFTSTLEMLDLLAKNDNDETDKQEEDDSNGSSIATMAEAIAVILNNPLNETILDANDKLEFKKSGMRFDFLVEQTCRQIVSENTTERIKNPKVGGNHRRDSSIESHDRCEEESEVSDADKNDDEEDDQDSRAKRNVLEARKSTAKPRISSGIRKRKKGHAGFRNNQVANSSLIERLCNKDNYLYRKRLRERFETCFSWVSFKSVCAKMRQLLIPMRAIRISVFGDEFSPTAEFKIKYQFISDPKRIPSYDNKKYYCRNRKVIDLSLKCDSVDDCGDGSDETTSSCGYHSAKVSLATANITSTNSKEDTEIEIPPVNDKKQQQPKNTMTSKKEKHIRPKSKHLTFVSGELQKCCEETNRFLPTNSKLRFKRIVGGKVTRRGQWPSQVSLQIESHEPISLVCAGTLIHPQYVVTAGHCITREVLMKGVRVVMGVHDLKKSYSEEIENSVDESKIQVRYVVDAVVYPALGIRSLPANWENDMNNDLALLRLNAPIRITDVVSPACLPHEYDVPSIDTKCKAIGWGQTHGSGQSSVLKETSVRVENSSICAEEILSGQSKSPGPEKDTETLGKFNNKTMLCVTNESDDSGICQGDSGGPLFCERQLVNGGKCTQMYGIASFIIQKSTVGSVCAVQRLPEIFSEVSSKVDWISASIKMMEQTYKLRYST